MRDNDELDKNKMSAEDERIKYFELVWRGGTSLIVSAFFPTINQVLILFKSHNEINRSISNF